MEDDREGKEGGFRKEYRRELEGESLEDGEQDYRFRVSYGWKEYCKGRRFQTGEQGTWKDVERKKLIDGD